MKLRIIALAIVLLSATAFGQNVQFQASTDTIKPVPPTKWWIRALGFTFPDGSKISTAVPSDTLFHDSDTSATVGVSSKYQTSLRIPYSDTTSSIAKQWWVKDQVRDSLAEYVLRANGVSTGLSRFDSAVVAKVQIKKIHQVYAMGNSLTVANVYEPFLQNLIGSNWAVNQRGIGGQTTAQMSARFANDVTNCGDAEYVIILGGINDIVSDYSATTIKTNLQAMYTAANSAGIKVVAVSITPFKTNVNWSAGRQSVLDDVNTWIADTATNIDYKVDAYSTLEDPGVPDALLATYDSGDHLHLSTVGYDTLAAVIYRNVTWTGSTELNSLGISTNDVQLNQNLRINDTPRFYRLTLDSTLTAERITTSRIGIGPAASRTYLDTVKGIATTGLAIYSNGTKYETGYFNRNVTAPQSGTVSLATDTDTLKSTYWMLRDSSLVMGKSSARLYAQNTRLYTTGDLYVNGSNVAIGGGSFVLSITSGVLWATSGDLPIQNTLVNKGITFATKLSGTTATRSSMDSTGRFIMPAIKIGTSQNWMLHSFKVSKFNGDSVATIDTVGNAILSGYTVTTDVRASDSVAAVTGRFSGNLSAGELALDSTAYGSVYIEDTHPDTIVVSATGIFYTVGAVKAPNGYKWTSGGVLKNVTVQDSSMTIGVDGNFEVSWSVSVSSANVTNGKFNWYLYVNDVKQDKTGAKRLLSGTNDLGCIAVAPTVLALKKNDIIKLKVQSIDDSSCQLIHEYAILHVKKITD